MQDCRHPQGPVASHSCGNLVASILTRLTRSCTQIISLASRRSDAKEHGSGPARFRSKKMSEIETGTGGPSCSVWRCRTKDLGGLTIITFHNANDDWTENPPSCSGQKTERLLESAVHQLRAHWQLAIMRRRSLLQSARLLSLPDLVSLQRGDRGRPDLPTSEPTAALFMGRGSRRVTRSTMPTGEVKHADQGQSKLGPCAAQVGRGGTVRSPQAGGAGCGP